MTRSSRFPSPGQLPVSGIDHMLFHCRTGFEGDCAAEITDTASELGIAGYCRAVPGSALASVHPAAEAVLPDALWQPVLGLIFPRLAVAGIAELPDLPEKDRVGAIAGAFDWTRLPPSGLILESPDTNEGRAVARFLRGFRTPLAQGLEYAGLTLSDKPNVPWLRFCFPDSGHVHIGVTPAGRPFDWRAGVPRLRLSREAPSRSALKLEEGLLRLLGPGERERFLTPGDTAVDLGAAPGGWSWVLAKRGLDVTAVDNGPLDNELLATGMVRHLRADGFTFRPERPVDWMVCDMVDKPVRVAELAGQWLQRGDCRHALFNLKLPMKQRFRESRAMLQRAANRAESGGRRVRTTCRHLYHDREEVTVFMTTEA